MYASKEPAPMNRPSRISEPHRLDIAHRPRRNRKAEWARRLVSEHSDFAVPGLEARVRGRCRQVLS
jgi:hypothetical protein